MIARMASIQKTVTNITVDTDGRLVFIDPIITIANGSGNLDYAEFTNVPSWIKVDLGIPYTVTRYTFDGTAICALQGSNDDKFYSNTIGSYRYYRLYITTTNCVLSNIKFYINTVGLTQYNTNTISNDSWALGTEVIKLAQLFRLQVNKPIVDVRYDYTGNITHRIETDHNGKPSGVQLQGAATGLHWLVLEGSGRVTTSNDGYANGYFMGYGGTYFPVNGWSRYNGSYNDLTNFGIYQS
jgi:hypothetical protein